MDIDILEVILSEEEYGGVFGMWFCGWMLCIYIMGEWRCLREVNR